MSETLTPAVAFAMGLFAALWLAAALWAVVRGVLMQRAAAFVGAQAERLTALLGASAQLPVIIRSDWRVEASDRLDRWLGIEAGIRHFDDMRGADCGLDAAGHEQLRQAIIAAQRGAKPFSLTLRPHGGHRTMTIRGGPAPAALGSAGTVLLWVSDATDGQNALVETRRERDDALGAFEALSGLIDAAPFPMWFRDTNLKLTLVNRAYVAAVEAKNSADAIHGEMELCEPVAGMSAAAAAALARDEGEAHIRTIPVTVMGERRIMRVADVPVAPSGGRMIGIAGYAVDMQELETERSGHRRFAEAQLELLDRLSAAVTQFGPDRHLLFANLPARHLFGIDPETLAEAPPFAQLLDRWRDAGRTPEVRDFSAWRQAHDRWFARAEAAEEDWLLRDGTHLRVVGQPTPDGGLLLIAEDRTEHVQLSGARDTLLRVRTATFDNLFEAIAVFAPDGRLHLWNQRFRRLWSIEEQHLVGHPRVDVLMAGLADRLAKPEQINVVQDIIRAATLERVQRKGEIRFADGRFFDFASIPLPDGNALLIMLDISDSRRIQSALRERNEALEAADKVKTAFLSRMSYELRTPLTSIAGFAEMLQEGYAGGMNDRQGSYMGAIMDSVAVLTRHIDNVLDLAQAEAGSLAIDHAPVDVRALIRQAVDDAAPFAATEGIEMATEMADDVGVIAGDFPRLLRLLGNLIDNAIRFTAPVRRDQGRVLVHASGNAQGVTLIVSDNGPGLPDDVAAVTSGQVAGTAAGGFGLALARQLVAAHEGVMDVITEKDQGTMIRITLPRAA
ncbi:MAG TPA: PAS-domain containing protein [Sphingopyxis sp.]|nr:PAS-domain containing protein [Sphingopyxis sp.]